LISPIFEEPVLLIRKVFSCEIKLGKKSAYSKTKANKQKECAYVSVTSVWLLGKQKMNAEMFGTSKI